MKILIFRIAIKDVKSQIKLAWCVAPEHQRLISGTEELEDTRDLPVSLREPFRKRRRAALRRLRAASAPQRWIFNKDPFFIEHYVEMVNECVNKHLFTLSSKHKKLCWILTSMCGGLKQQFHPWIKPMKRVPNKSLKQLQNLYPNMKETDLETLDAVITDRELEELLESYGIESK